MLSDVRTLFQRPRTPFFRDYSPTLPPPNVAYPHPGGPLNRGAHASEA